MSAKKQHVGNLFWIALDVFLFCVHMQDEPFGCLKLANCPQFGLLFASIASRIAFVCLAIQQVGATKVENNLLSNLTFATDQFYGLPWVESRIPTTNISRFSRGSEPSAMDVVWIFGAPRWPFWQYSTTVSSDLSVCVQMIIVATKLMAYSQALLHPQT